MASGSQTCLKEALALTVNFFGGRKAALAAAASYQKLAGFLCWPGLIWHLCIPQGEDMKGNEQEGNLN